jgi:AcrR family transcriptional regulator
MTEVKSRREMYSEATRAALLDEATALFAERGYAGTSLEDVASASQVTRGAVYHHFASKQALFEAVLQLRPRRSPRPRPCRIRGMRRSSR